MSITLTIADDYDELSRITASHIIRHINENPTGLFCFAGGDTPVATLRLIAEAASAGVVDLSRAHFVELDEWVGVDESDPGSCVSYLRRNLFEPAGIGEVSLHRFDPGADDLDEECRRADEYIVGHGGISLALLGVGVNGHLGFNEPGSDIAASAHVVELTETTRSVGTKYFEGEDAGGRTVASRGITLGLAQLLGARELIIQANGPKKRDAIAHALMGTYDSAWPVTSIWKHPHGHLAIDRAAR